MGWSKTKPRRADPAGRPWSRDEAEMLVDAVGRAPSVHNTPPWSLDVRYRRATLSERQEPEFLQHDAEKRDRRLFCGAALANLVLAVRNTGWTAEVRWPEPDDPAQMVATVLAYGHQRPSATEGQRYRAITRRTSYHHAFVDAPIPHATRETLWAAASSPTVTARWITGEQDARVLARQLSYGARVFHGDQRYQGELSAWTAEDTEQEYGTGIPATSLGTEGVPAVGLTSSAQRLPDEEALAARIDDESVLVLSTASDAAPAHVQTGVAMELAWLSATSLGLVVSVLTQPFHLSEIRTDLARGLSLAGVPEVVMRFGYPAAPVPRGARRSSSELTADEDDQR